MIFSRIKFAAILPLFVCINSFVVAQTLTGFSYKDNTGVEENIVRSGFQFNGYTNYWHDNYREWLHYGNLYKIAIPDIAHSIMQSKVDIAEDLELPGLSLQEGFFSNLSATACLLLEEPSLLQIEEALAKSDVLITVNPDSETGRRITKDIPTYHATVREVLKSHQYGAKDFVEISAFVLEKGNRKLFVISSTDRESRNKLIKLIDSTKEILKNYDLHKGWFGAKTLEKSVTCTPGHYMEVMGKGMDEGNDWFIFDGYMDFLAQKELDEWVKRGNLPVVADVGTPPIYGCENYDGLQVQGNYTPEKWITYAHERGGYAFKQVVDTPSLVKNLPYDGYIAYDARVTSLGFDGNKEQIDNEDVPFICPTLDLHDDAIPSMVLFIKKQEPLTKKNLWDAIMTRREVAVLNGGKMMGPAQYRQALGLLLLDRVFPEEYFGDRIRIRAFVEGYTLHVIVANTYPQAIEGKLEVILPPELKVKEESTILTRLSAKGVKEMQFSLQPLSSAMGKANPVTLHFNWGAHRKSTATMLNLPRFISVHQLLYGHAPTVSYPVTIHNFSDQSSFPVNIEVSSKKNPKKIVYKSSGVCTAPTGAFQDLSFNLKTPPGSYRVKVSALGIENISQLGVGTVKGVSVLSEVDLNNDGVNEYRMENDSVQVTLLTIGARVIEYIVKSRNDNVLFKSWPEKAEDDNRAYRKRGYYPFGGFEDFLGQASMETHKVYKAEILKSKGDYTQLKMTADYFGNKIEKIFTLYGNSPLLEVRFALTFKNPEANVIGPQPILELGKRHWTEDVFTVPGKDGLQEFIMEPERTYGRVLYLKEGWNAGYDTEEDVSFVGAFPVTEPLFLHLWMNHPRNRDAHHYYVEFQPWTPIYQKSTMYFTYYMWGTGGHWQKGVDELRNRNLISTQ
jgi:hypothetical protein